MTTPSANTPGPDHAAKSGSVLASLPGRTLLQGAAIDILLALCLVIYNAASSDNIDWAIMWSLIVKSFLMTGASSIMKRLKPPPVSAITN